MKIGDLSDFCKRHDVTDAERHELRWYLLYLRWRKAAEAITHENR